MKPNFNRILRENNNSFVDDFDDFGDSNDKHTELQPIFNQIESILKYEYLERKNMVVTMVTTIEGIRAVYIIGRNEEQYILAIYIRKNNEDFINTYGRKVNPFEVNVDVSAMAVMSDTKVFNVCFDLYTEYRDDEDIIGRFYANDNRYFYSAPYGVLCPIEFQPIEPGEL